MGFLDNSGDIILDAVLTDAGRKRLAEGNGSFRIAKYAFGDDEIDYSNYNANHASGSAYYDLEILQTPVLEAFTNNAASMKSKLITLTNNNILYLPVIKVNDKGADILANTTIGSGSHVVVVDTATQGVWRANSGENTGGMGYYVDGVTPGDPNSRVIRCDQGLDTSEIPATFKIDAELNENQYIVEIDNRFGSIVTHQGILEQSWSYLDDDNIASYFLSTNYVAATPAKPSTGTEPEARTMIAGPRGTNLQFKIQASTNLRTSEYLFDRLGSSFNFNVTNDSADNTVLLGPNIFKFIDTIIRVTGATTGYKLDIPIRFVKQTGRV
jgi:hypothetical protein